MGEFMAYELYLNKLIISKKDHEYVKCHHMITSQHFIFICSLELHSKNIGSNFVNY